MAVNLTKGQKVDLTKGNAGLTKIFIGLGWDTNKYDGGHDFDLDASAFLVGTNGKVAADADFVFYGNLRHSSGGVEHSGDNLTGDDGSGGDADDEVINVDLSRIPASVDRVAFTATIHDAEPRSQNFGMVSNAYIRVVDASTNVELIHYDLGEDYSIETAVVVGEIYRQGSEWKFNAVGSGFRGGLRALCQNFGVNV